MLDWRSWKVWGVPLVGMGAISLFAAGIIFWGGFNTAMEATNTLNFCISCHEMESTVYQEYKSTISLPKTALACVLSALTVMYQSPGYIKWFAR